MVVGETMELVVVLAMVVLGLAIMAGIQWWTER